MIECIVKYAIYSSLGYGTHRDIKHGMSYEDDMQHHNFRSLIQNHLSVRIKGTDLSKDLSIFKRRKGADNDVIDLYEKWKPEIRYAYKGKKVDKKRITEFIEKVEEAHTIIKRAVGG